MRILHINNCDIKGGAAKVGYRLSGGLISRGHDVMYLVAKKYSSDDFVREIASPPAKSGGISQRVLHRFGLDVVTLDGPFPAGLGKDFIEGFDVVHLHDIMGGYFNLRGLAWLSNLKPVAWTLQTMWPFTGACLYSYDCRRWKKNCGKCPQFGKFPLIGLHRDTSFLAINIKRLIYARSRLFPVGVSDWVSNLAREGILGRFEIERIANSVDTGVFYPADKQEARAKLKIPPESRTIMFSVAANPEDTRKGIDIILKALPLLKTKNIFLLPLTITGGAEKVEEALKEYPSLKATHIGAEHELNLIYNAADVLWHPSRADTSSLVILEAFAAGTPVIASKVGGVQEIVIDGESGFFIEPGNPRELAAKTDAFFSDEEARMPMSKEARKRAVSEHSLDAALDKYENLYKRIVEKWKP